MKASDRIEIRITEFEGVFIDFDDRFNRFKTIEEARAQLKKWDAVDELKAENDQLKDALQYLVNDCYIFSGDKLWCKTPSILVVEKAKQVLKSLEDESSNK